MATIASAIAIGIDTALPTEVIPISKATATPNRWRRRKTGRVSARP